MKTVQFDDVNKKLIIHGDITWETLHTTTAVVPDLRFTLYEYVNNTKLNNAVLVDIDHAPLLAYTDLLKKIEAVFGEYKMYHVFTGNGHHVYIPLVNTFTAAPNLSLIHI